MTTSGTTGGGNRSQGSLYGIGVGPGDPELLTIKAQRTLQRVPVICFTQLDDGKESYALSVVRDVLEAAKPEFLAITIPSDDDTPISPETWTESAKEIAGHLRGGKDVAFITEGDPMLVSGLVIERGGLLSHGAIVAREFGLPCVVAVENATERIEPGRRVTVDGDRGICTIERRNAAAAVPERGVA